MRKFLRKRRGVQGSLPWMERLLLTAPGSVRRVRYKALPVRGAGGWGACAGGRHGEVFHSETAIPPVMQNRTRRENRGKGCKLTPTESPGDTARKVPWEGAANRPLHGEARGFRISQFLQLEQAGSSLLPIVCSKAFREMSIVQFVCCGKLRS